MDPRPCRVSVKDEGHRLQVRVERIPEVLHDVLADAIVEVRLAHADEAADDGEGDHGHHEEVEQHEVLLRDRHVDELLQEDRVDDPQEARHDDGGHDDGDLQPIQQEEGHDAAHGASASFPGHRREVAAGEAGLCGAGPGAPSHHTAMVAQPRPRPLRRLDSPTVEQQHDSNPWSDVPASPRPSSSSASAAAARR